jgi:hypothetical protein
MKDLQIRFTAMLNIQLIFSNVLFRSSSKAPARSGEKRHMDTEAKEKGSPVFAGEPFVEQGLF